ncbi:MAG: tRNA (N6-isopentenyl adenosine(37)-C2)-methylthiotransferase MiaB [Elusimicrobiaceae bacterium]|nr:tRNA (N6-isopentenyl adenosine(37)-C2)-methylthiotransferase MiaB [Elusimicrobiaceae bacterium]
MKKLFIQTYGCQMNIADSEEMAAHLLERGYIPTENLEEADLALINTCTVRDHAEHRALSFLGRLRKWKRENPQRIIIFAGCAAQRLGESLKKTFPFLDLVCGAKEIDGFAELLDKSGLFTLDQAPAAQPPTSITGYVTIMRGCDFKCSYCIVPSVRGPIQCLPSAEILKNAALKAAQGYKEIVLLGQTVNAWKEDGKTFADLLNEVSALEGVERVRFVSPHPIFITPDFLKAVENNPKIARHIHLPVQSGSSKVLQEMKRGYNREILLEKLDALKERGFAISTDIIVGFPTETEADFQQTLSLVERVHFSAAYCFKYSPRQGTPAAEMTLFPEKILEERLDILLNKVKGLAESSYQAQLGKTVQILMQTPNKGRTSDNFWAQTRNSYPVGSVINTEVVGVEDTLLLTRD